MWRGAGKVGGSLQRPESRAGPVCGQGQGTESLRHPEELPGGIQMSEEGQDSLPRRGEKLVPDPSGVRQ